MSETANEAQVAEGEALTHFDEAGRARMVDVGAKPDTAREATAAGAVRMRAATLARIRAGGIGKGDPLAVAQVAGVMAAKQTALLIPLCHPIPLTGVELAFTLDDAPPLPAPESPDAPGEVAGGDAEGAARVHIRATVRTVGKTGAEMEALTAVSVAALTLYDMCKAIDRGMVIESVRLVRKSGGKTGEYVRDESNATSNATIR